MSKKKITTPKTSEANEPAVVYGSNRIHFFKSLEEQEEYGFKMSAAIPPLENFKTVTEMVKRFYKKQLKEKPQSNRIYFD